MDERRFWDMLEETRPPARGRGLLRRKPSGPDLEQHSERLVEALAALGAEEIADFDRIWHELSARAYRWDLWGAAYVINGGCSDDCFDYFRDYLISLGRDAYERALSDPESLAGFAHAEDDVGYESVSYVAMDAWERSGAEGDLPRPAPAPAEPVGEPWDEEGVEELYPRLAARFWR